MPIHEKFDGSGYPGNFRERHSIWCARFRHHRSIDAMIYKEAVQHSCFFQGCCAE
jgi:response regulator RpfG family c-di-GMP phosphodiesterase